jgi:hypothetical protein
MSTVKVIDVLIGYRGAVIVCTVADGATHSWTVPEGVILDEGIIFKGTETPDVRSQ